MFTNFPLYITGSLQHSVHAPPSLFFFVSSVYTSFYLLDPSFPLLTLFSSMFIFFLSFEDFSSFSTYLHSCLFDSYLPLSTFFFSIFTFLLSTVKIFLRINILNEFNFSFSKNKFSFFSIFGNFFGLLRRLLATFTQCNTSIFQSSFAFTLFCMISIEVFRKFQFIFCTMKIFHLFLSYFEAFSVENHWI